MNAVLLTVDDQGGAFIHWSHKELSPTLRARMDGHQPVVVLENENIFASKTRTIQEQPESIKPENERL